MTQVTMTEAEMREHIVQARLRREQESVAGYNEQAKALKFGKLLFEISVFQEEPIIDMPGLVDVQIWEAESVEQLMAYQRKTIEERGYEILEQTPLSITYRIYPFDEDDPEYVNRREIHSLLIYSTSNLIDGLIAE